MRPQGDPGLFGPDSVTWRVVADPLMGVAGVRALLQQSLDPVATAGLDALSRYRREPWKRLVRTGDFVALATYGDRAGVEAAAAGIRRGHARSWTDPVTGRSHRLDDPASLEWVHNCLVDSMIDVVVRGGARLTAAEQDRFVAEQVRFGALVGLDPATLPTTREALADYFAAVRPRLRLTPAAVDAVATILAIPLPAGVEFLTPARAGWSTVAALAYGSLPRWARELFPLPVGVDRLGGPAVTAGLRALRLAGTGIRRAVPPARRHPYEREARARLGLTA